MEFFLKGLAIGFSIAAPVGPIGLLTIRRTLIGGWASGFATGMGAATADAFYGAVAAFGLTAISALLMEQQQWLRLFGGLFLAWMGYKTFTAPVVHEGKGPGELGVWRDYLSSLLLTVTNPATILSFVAVFAGLGLTAASSYADAAALIGGVFVGSAIWWLLLSGSVSRMRHNLQPRHMLLINRFSGGLLLGFAALALLSLFF